MTELNATQQEDVFRGLGVRIQLPTKESFLIVAETLERIGVANHRNKTLYQSCHILHKRGEFAIMHFKELFKMDGRWSDISEEDIARRNRIANLLDEWGLVELPEKMDASMENGKVPQVKVLSFSEAEGWVLQPKYQIGKKRIQKAS